MLATIENLFLEILQVTRKFFFMAYRCDEAVKDCQLLTKDVEVCFNTDIFEV
jgi:hypothetical protein